MNLAVSLHLFNDGSFAVRPRPSDTLPPSPASDTIPCPAPDVDPGAPTLDAIPDDEEDERPMCPGCGERGCEDEDHRPATKADFDRAPYGKCTTCRGRARVIGPPSECWDCYCDRTAHGQCADCGGTHRVIDNRTQREVACPSCVPAFTSLRTGGGW